MVLVWVSVVLIMLRFLSSIDWWWLDSEKEMVWLVVCMMCVLMLMDICSGVVLLWVSIRSVFVFVGGSIVVSRLLFSVLV